MKKCDALRLQAGDLVDVRGSRLEGRAELGFSIIMRSRSDGGRNSPRKSGNCSVRRLSDSRATELSSSGKSGSSVFRGLRPQGLYGFVR
jgi:hypothetical protein